MKFDPRYTEAGSCYMEETQFQFSDPAVTEKGCPDCKKFGGDCPDCQALAEE